MKKLNYIQEKIKEVEESIIDEEFEVNERPWEFYRLNDLKKELSILREIEEDLKQLQTV